MKKSELIILLNDIEGDPDIIIKHPSQYGIDVERVYTQPNNVTRLEEIIISGS